MLPLSNGFSRLRQINERAVVNPQRASAVAQPFGRRVSGMLAVQFSLFETEQMQDQAAQPAPDNNGDNVPLPPQHSDER